MSLQLTGEPAGGTVQDTRFHAPNLGTGSDTGFDRRPEAEITDESTTFAAPATGWVTGPQRAAAAHAVRRDLARLVRVLADPVTTVRRAALVGHVGYLVDQLAGADPDLARRHAAPLSRLRHESRRWTREPGRRAEVLAAAERTIDLLGPGPATGPDEPPSGTDRCTLTRLASRRPTALAFRHFWLLDELPPRLGDPVTAEFTAPARWVLRNALSGGYNRRAYLMWFGGGAGPAW